MTRCLASVTSPQGFSRLYSLLAALSRSSHVHPWYVHLITLSTQSGEISPLALLKQKPTETLPDLILSLKALEPIAERTVTDHIAKAFLLNNLNWETMTSEHRQACQGHVQEHYDK